MKKGDKVSKLKERKRRREKRQRFRKREERSLAAEREKRLAVLNMEEEKAVVEGEVEPGPIASPEFLERVCEPGGPVEALKAAKKYAAYQDSQLRARKDVEEMLAELVEKSAVPVPRVWVWLENIWLRLRYPAKYPDGVVVRKAWWYKIFERIFRRGG